MSEEETFDIYGDDDTTSPSSPSQQSGPKKRLRRERSSSAPPLISPKDEDDDGASTPRQKKVKEDESNHVNHKNGDAVEDDEDPFREYDNHVFTYQLPPPGMRRGINVFFSFFIFFYFVLCIETDVV
jgi:hypothetical protein